eukprot:4601314-Prymnesium_polylepis.1
MAIVRLRRRKNVWGVAHVTALAYCGYVRVVCFGRVWAAAECARARAGCVCACGAWRACAPHVQHAHA